MPKSSIVTKEVMKIKVWTEAYRPFVMGGRVRYPVMAEVEATGPHALGKGYFGYLITAPDGSTLVAESETGALVGPTLEEVKADIKSATKQIMKEQIEHARERVKIAEQTSADNFWKMLRKKPAD